MEDSEDTKHYQVSFFSHHENYKAIPNTIFSVPEEATVQNLNALVNTALQDISEGDSQPVVFEFLVGSALLRGTLKEVVEENGIPTETVITIECLLREPPPTPEADVTLSDWVGAVKTTDKFIIAATYDGTLSCWSHSGERLITTTYQEEALKCIEVLPETSDCKVLSGGHSQTIILCRMEESKNDFLPIAAFRGHERSIECLAINANGSRFVSGSFDTYLKKAVKQASFKLDLCFFMEADDEGTNYKRKDAGKAKKRKTVITKTPIVTLAGHKDAIVGVSWLPSSENHVASVSWDHSLLFWDLELEGQIGSMPSSKSFTCLAVCPSSGLIVTGSVDPVVRLWDPRSREGSLVKQTFLGHTKWVSSLSWSPNNDRVFISSSFDQVTKMWDIRSGKTPLYEMKGHTDRILCCDWSYKNLIVSGGVDCSMKVFKTES